MKHFPACGVLVVAAVLASCGEGRDVTAPDEGREKWGWSEPLATGGGGGTGCEDSFVECDPPTMNCSPLTVDFHGEVICTLEVSPIQNALFMSWSFLSDGGIPVSGPSGTDIFSWSGPMVVSGTVRVDVTIVGDPNPQTLTANVIVNRRSGWSWSSVAGGRQGTPGEIDACMTSALSGLTASANCTATTTGDLFTPRALQLANGNGYSAAVVAGNGPNGSLWYVEGRTAIMDLRTQVHRDFRSDGPTYAMTGSQTVIAGCNSAFGNLNPRNIHTVNTACVNTPQFGDYVSCVWSHEGQHLSAAITSARNAANDVYALWEPLASRTEAELQTEARRQYSDANSRVFDDAAVVENSMTPYTRTFWYSEGSGWSSSTFGQRC